MKVALFALLTTSILLTTALAGGWHGNSGGWHNGYRRGYYRGGYYGHHYWNAGYYRWHGGWRWFAGGYNPWWVFLPPIVPVPFPFPYYGGYGPAYGFGY